MEIGFTKERRKRKERSRREKEISWCNYVNLRFPKRF